MIKLLQDSIFQIENKSYHPKFTDFMEKAIKWDDIYNGQNRYKRFNLSCLET